MPDDDKTQNDSADNQTDLLAALRDMVEEGKKTSEPVNPPKDPPAQPSIGERYKQALDEGDNDAIAKLLDEQAAAGNVGAMLQHGTLVRELAQSKIGEDFDKYADEVEELAKKRGVNTRLWQTIDDWRDAIAFAKAKHLPEIEAAAEERARQKLLEEAEQKAKTPPKITIKGTKPDDEPTELDISDFSPEALKVAKGLREPLPNYVRNVRIAEKFDDGRGGVEKVPLIDADMEQTDEYGDPVVNPGQF